MVPSLAAWFTSAFSASSVATTSARPLPQAAYSGVSPSLSALFTSAFSASSVATTSMWPL